MKTIYNINTDQELKEHYDGADAFEAALTETEKELKAEHRAFHEQFQPKVKAFEERVAAEGKAYWDVIREKLIAAGVATREQAYNNRLSIDSETGDIQMSEKSEEELALEESAEGMPNALVEALQAIANGKAPQINL